MLSNKVNETKKSTYQPINHQPTSEEILVEDELKLKTSFGNLLKQQLEKALALLYWLKTKA